MAQNAGYSCDMPLYPLLGNEWCMQVLREFAVTAGLGRKRPRGRRETRPKMGTEGEDVVVEEGGGLKLKMPTRYGPGTVKAAAWQVSVISLSVLPSWY